MAIDKDTGISVSVQVNGADLPEYEPPESVGHDNARPVITKYIESFDDADFTICVIADIPYGWGRGELNESALSFRVALDGQKVACRCLTHMCPESTVDGAETLEPDGGRVEKQFQFTSISTGAPFFPAALFPRTD